MTAPSGSCEERCKLSWPYTKNSVCSGERIQRKLPAMEAGRDLSNPATLQRVNSDGWQEGRGLGENVFSKKHVHKPPAYTGGGSIHYCPFFTRQRGILRGRGRSVFLLPIRVIKV